MHNIMSYGGVSFMCNLKYLTEYCSWEQEMSCITELLTGDWQSEEEEPGPPRSWVLLSHPRIWWDLGLHFIGLRGWELQSHPWLPYKNSMWFGDIVHTNDNILTQEHREETDWWRHLENRPCWPIRNHFLVFKSKVFLQLTSSLLCPESTKYRETWCPDPQGNIGKLSKQPQWGCDERTVDCVSEMCFISSILEQRFCSQITEHLMVAEKVLKEKCNIKKIGETQFVLLLLQINVLGIDPVNW